MALQLRQNSRTEPSFLVITRATSGAPPPAPQWKHLSPLLCSRIFCFVPLEKSEVDDVLDSFSLSMSLRLRSRLRLGLDELVSPDAGTGDGNIVAVGGGNTADRSFFGLCRHCYYCCYCYSTQGRRMILRTPELLPQQCNVIHLIRFVARDRVPSTSVHTTGRIR